MIAIDPGVQACGVSCFGSDGILAWASYVPCGNLLRVLRPHIVDHHALVIEMPRIYPGSGQQKGDLNDLLNLATVVGRCEELFSMCAMQRVFPASWKGQVPKKIMTARILSRLSKEETERILRVGAKDHNTIDAVGIGLWKLGRL